MQRLSGLDATFLYLETAQQPLHVCSILELDTTTIPGGYAFGELKDELATRIRGIPSFREKLVDSFLNLDHPVWVTDEDFDIDRHVHRIGLPSPGGRKELAEFCGHIAALPLDRSRPLWETWVIEGLDGTDPRDGGRVAVLTKVHHAGVDGVSGANLMTVLCSTEPEAPPPDPVESSGGVNQLELAATGLLRFATRPLQLAKVVPLTLASVVETVRRGLTGQAMTSPFRAPKSPFNAKVTSHRNVAWAQLDLNDLKTVKDRFDVKLNDVVMALCAGVLRQFLADRGGLPTQPLVATVPVSVRDKSDRDGRNQVSAMFSRLETHIEDP
ncbi:MAG: wax ester/triacylglycerol synthase family O-acyltransferase, partial [Mycobacterium sp.]